MHTDPVDPNGPNLNAIVHELGLLNGEVKFSTNKLDFAQLASMYNISDVTVNISDAEGFGLSSLESLNCSTPIIVNMTGGLQEQVTNGEEWFGVGIEPSSKAVIGSQDIPYIYEDRINKQDFIDALEKLYNMTEDERNNPKIIDFSRRKRIANGSGSQIEDVNKLIKQFSQMGKMMKMMKNGGLDNMLKNMGGVNPNFK